MTEIHVNLREREQFVLHVLRVNRKPLSAAEVGKACEVKPPTDPEAWARRKLEYQLKNAYIRSRVGDDGITRYYIWKVGA